MNELALFAGVGGSILGGKLLGWRTVCAVERDAYAASVLAARQNDGSLEPFPIWSDVCSFEGARWQGIVDAVSCGFPCQNISPAGPGEGIAGEKSGLWLHGARIIREVRPAYVIVENSPALVVRGLGRVLGDLAALGYDARWDVLGDADCGGDTERKRLWLVANLPGFGRPEVLRSDARRSREATGKRATDNAHPRDRLARLHALEKMAGEPAILGEDCRIPFIVDRLHGIGNAQFPRVVKRAWETLSP